MYYIAQFVGFLGMAACFMIFQQNERKKLLLWKLTADFLWFLHYVLLGGFSGAAVCVIAMIRGTVYLNEGKKWANKKVWICILFALNIPFVISTWNGIMSIFPTLASYTAICSFAMQKPKLTRILGIPVSAFMITYDIFTGSIAGLINESVSITSTIIGFIRHDIKKQ